MGPGTRKERPTDQKGSVSARDRCFSTCISIIVHYRTMSNTLNVVQWQDNNSTARINMHKTLLKCFVKHEGFHGNLVPNLLEKLFSMSNYSLQRPYLTKRPTHLGFWGYHQLTRTYLSVLHRYQA